MALPRMVQALGMALLLCLACTARATDHWDGPAVSAEPAADITDFFAVALPGRQLAFIMNVYPGATANTRFSDAVEYRIRWRPIRGFSAQPLRAQVDAALEYQLRCRADAAATQTMRCSLLRNGSTLFTFNVTDFSDSIAMKMFAKTKDDVKILSQLANGKWVKARGRIEYDRFMQEPELVMMSACETA